MLDERSKRRRERLKAMSSAAPGIEAEAVSDAVYFVASSLLQRAVESAAEAEAEVLAVAVAKAVAKALPQVVDVEIDLGDDVARYEIKVSPEDVAEDLAQWAIEHVPGIIEELVKSAGEDA